MLKRMTTALLLSLLLWTMSACSTLPQVIVVDKQAALNSETVAAATELTWWRFAVKIHWPQQETPAWQMDLLLADQVVAPVLRDYAETLTLWRFHRRAGRDKAGHRFSFIFHADAQLARQIYQSLHQRIALLEGVGLRGLDRIQQTDSQRPPKLSVAATSDPSWDVAIQSTWPYFIKGVSESWLMLVSRLAQIQFEQLDQNQAQELPSFETLLDVYKTVSKQVEGLWREQGAHAYLHHLNAVFGYTQTVVTERRLMRF